ncbi:hypothetical protein JCM8547_000982 [Rhodosporidiobolus lusitaniae]
MAIPDIVPTSEQGQALQAAIQKQLATLGWSTEDDAVMAEYCLVMLGNRKTADQISTELSDLIGSDFDPSFVTWLFDEVKKHYPDPAAKSPAAPPPSAPTGPSSSRAPNGVPTRPSGPVGGNRNVFGAAVGGVKRSAEDGGLDGRGGGRPRFEAPGRAPHQQAQGGKSLFDRVNGSNPQFAPGRNLGPVNNTGMPQPAFDAITQTVNAILAGAHPSLLTNIPFPALVAHPLSQRLPPGVLAQAQAAAMAQAQAMVQMQNVWNNAAPAAALASAGSLSAAAPAFNPSFAAPGARGGAAQAAGKPAAPPVKLPSKPEQEAICKHGVECTKPQCPFSHPSPVATKESGLVLNSEACEKQLKCDDADCPRSHISRAQLTHPAPSSSSSALSRPPPVAAAPAPAFGAPPTGTPCKFGAACTRPGCYFVHPWDVSGVPGGNGGGAAATPCRYGAGCTRADCHFSHPPSRPTPYSSSRSNKYVKPSAAGGKKQEANIGAWPTESKEHISERLKRFSGGANGGANGEGGKEGEAERIVPGQGGDGKHGEEKVEIHLDDGDDEKEEEKPAEKEAATA